MPRNIKKESEWSKYHYERFYLALTKDYADKMRKILKVNNTTYTQFIKVMIDYMYNAIEEEKQDARN